MKSILGVACQRGLAFGGLAASPEPKYNAHHANRFRVDTPLPLSEVAELCVQ